MPRQLILGSTSQPRKALLMRLQYPFNVVAPAVDETPLPNETAPALVKRLAFAKAQAVAKHYPDAVIIAADQVGVLDDSIIGKPHDYATAVQQLTASSGKILQFFTGLCVLDTRSAYHQYICEPFAVHYRELTAAMIKSYLQREQPYQCAGACQADGLGIVLIERFEGGDATALIGLPLIHLVTMLTNAGINLLY